jgi:hypothetical protein
MKTRLFAAMLFAAAVCAGPALAQAAGIYLDPATGTFPAGVTFAVNIRLDTQGQCINAAQVNLAYPKDELTAVAVSGGDSILSLWVKNPTIYANYGLVSFIGGLPGGYCGRVAGDTSLSNTLATVYFEFPTSTTAASATIPIAAKLAFASGTEAVLNDGLGTPAQLSLSGAAYEPTYSGQFAPASAWENLIESDTTPPEPFQVGVYRDPSLFDGQLFAVFSTVDKQTGIDHYEVAEVPKAQLSLPENQWNWVRADSPYLLQNQNLDGALEVRAIDVAGNERLESYSFQQKAQSVPSWQLLFLPYLATIGIVGSLLAALLIQLIVHIF